MIKTKNKYFTKMIFVIFIIIIINIVFISYLFNALNNSTISAEELSKIKMEVLSTDINKDEVFDLAFNKGYEAGKKKMSIFSTIITGNIIPLITQSSVK